MSPCIGTLNVNGIAVVSVEKKKIDIVCLQETQCSIDAESKWENLTRGGWGGCGIKKISRKK